MNQEKNKCDFCGEIKPVFRLYARIKNKHFDDNKQGKYSKFFSYCNDCGIEPPDVLSSNMIDKTKLREEFYKYALKDEIDDLSFHELLEETADYWLDKFDQHLQELERAVEGIEEEYWNEHEAHIHSECCASSTVFKKIKTLIRGNKD